MFDWEIFTFDDCVSINIRDWHLSCRDQVEIIIDYVVHLPFFVGQLTSCICRILIFCC
ncbi:Uncharacterised protein [Mycobacterium tuberculosis]|nr:Uncharacterised protein [Mycobacterium tuberculosis]